MDLFERIAAARERWDVLKHPFYTRWERGELTREELADYSGQYRHAVVALAETAAKAAPLAGLEHAEEERAHVDLWDDFARAVGGNGASANSQTTECVDAWSAEDELEALAVLYAVESAQPAISKTKLAGLGAHYGIAEDASGAAYFVLHSERDHEHAEQSRRLLAEHASRGRGSARRRRGDCLPRQLDAARRRRSLGAGGGTRTHDLALTRRLLYQLSYSGRQRPIIAAPGATAGASGPCA
jgi:pyrroloquinoline-quinone synthase